MAQTRPCDVNPDNPQDRYSLALQDINGGWFGLDVPIPNIRPSTQNQPAPLQRVGINSYHAGRGFDKFVPEQYGYFDALVISGAQGIELLTWIAARATLGAKVNDVFRNYHIPISNTAPA